MEQEAAHFTDADPIRDPVQDEPQGVSNAGIAEVSEMGSGVELTEAYT
jgi:hypothetical protein